MTDESLPIPDPEHRPDPLIASAKAELANDLDETDIGQIVDASEQILRAKRRAQSEVLSIGAHLSLIHEVCYSRCQKAYGDTKRASARATDILVKWSEDVLQLRRTSVYLYLSIHRRFLQNNRAISPFNLTELQILVSPSISDDVVESMAIAKKQNPNMHRDDFRKLCSALQNIKEGSADAAARLQNAEDQINEGIATQREQADEIATLRLQLSNALTDLDNNIVSLQEAQKDIHQNSGVVGQLQVTLSEITRERDQLAADVASAKARVRVATTTTDPQSQIALREANAKLASLTQQLAEAQAKLAAASLGPTHQKDRIASSEALVVEQLLADLSALASKARTARENIMQMNDPIAIRTALEVAVATTQQIQQELSLAMNAAK